MGLREDIQTDIASAFNTDLADAVKPFTLFQKQAVSYQASTGDVIYTTAEAVSRGVLEPSVSKETDTNVRAAIAQLTILQNELLLSPRINDQVTVGVNTYTVIGVEPDPASATWVLALGAGADGGPV